MLKNLISQSRLLTTINAQMLAQGLMGVRDMPFIANMT